MALHPMLSWLKWKTMNVQRFLHVSSFYMGYWRNYMCHFTSRPELCWDHRLVGIKTSWFCLGFSSCLFWFFFVCPNTFCLRFFNSTSLILFYNFKLNKYLFVFSHFFQGRVYRKHILIYYPPVPNLYAFLSSTLKKTFWKITMKVNGVQCLSVF